MKDLTRILTDNGYECLVRYEDCGGYIIGFASTDYSLGADHYELLTAEEAEALYFNRRENLENIDDSEEL